MVFLTRHKSADGGGGRDVFQKALNTSMKAKKHGGWENAPFIPLQCKTSVGQCKQNRAPPKNKLLGHLEAINPSPPLKSTLPNSYQPKTKP